MWHFDRKMVLVTPINGWQPADAQYYRRGENKSKPYQTYLLSFQLCDSGLACYVSGPEMIIQAENANITELDGSPLKLDGATRLNGEVWGQRTPTEVS